MGQFPESVPIPVASALRVFRSLPSQRVICEDILPTGSLDTP